MLSFSFPLSPLPPMLFASLSHPLCYLPLSLPSLLSFMHLSSQVGNQFQMKRSNSTRSLAVTPKGLRRLTGSFRKSVSRLGAAAKGMGSMQDLSDAASMRRCISMCECVFKYAHMSLYVYYLPSYVHSFIYYSFILAVIAISHPHPCLVHTHPRPLFSPPVAVKQRWIAPKTRKRRKVLLAFFGPKPTGCVYVYVCMYVMYVCMYVCMYVHVSICTCVNNQIYSILPPLPQTACWRSAPHLQGEAQTTPRLSPCYEHYVSYVNNKINSVIILCIRPRLHRFLPTGNKPTIIE